MPYQLTGFDPSRTALLVIDMQSDFLVPGSPVAVRGGEDIIPAVERALDHARSSGMLVVFTAQVHRAGGSDLGRLAELWPFLVTGEVLVEGSAGADLHPRVVRQADEPLILKRRYSAFFGTDLDVLLRGRGIDTVLIAGVTTENCCHATARDAMFHDYRVGVLGDAVATSDPDVQRITLAVLNRTTGHVLSVDQAMAVTEKAPRR
jgi:ureidoacrylate peracid hydrolase